MQNVDNWTCSESYEAAKIILSCRPNAVVFEDRILLLDEVVEVRRATYRLRPSQFNGVFESKVVSRNHALFWYANRKFFVQDMQSSYGTFVNCQRIGDTCSENKPFQLFSGDIIQFGETVTDITGIHQCVIGTITTYLPNEEGRAVRAVEVSRLVSPETVLIEEMQKLEVASGRSPVKPDVMPTYSRDELLHQGKQFLESNLMMLQFLSYRSMEFYYDWKFLPVDILRTELTSLTDEELNNGLSDVKEAFQVILYDTLDGIKKLQDLGFSQPQKEDDEAHLLNDNETRHPRIDNYTKVQPRLDTRFKPPPSGAYYLIIGNDQDEEGDEFLLSDGHSRFDFSDHNAVQDAKKGYPLWIFISSDNLPDVASVQPACLVQLKLFQNSHFFSFNVTRQIPLRTCNDIFISGGVIIPDSRALCFVNPSMLLNILSLMQKKQDIDGLWKLAVHKHILNDLQELRPKKFENEAPNKQSLKALEVLKLLTIHQKSHLVRYISHHSCDDEPECVQLSCVKRAQKHHYRTHRHIIVVTNADPETAALYQESGAIVVNFNELIHKYLL